MDISSLIEDRVYHFEKGKVKDSYENTSLEPIFQTFTVKCEKNLSSRSKNILKTWKGKAFYYANEDILYLFKFNPIEQDFFLKILHSMAIFLQNATSASFFDIYIDDINITQIPRFNHSNTQKSHNIDLLDCLSFKLKCSVTPPPEKPETPW